MSAFIPDHQHDSLLMLRVVGHQPTSAGLSILSEILPGWCRTAPKGGNRGNRNSMLFVELIYGVLCLR